MRSLRVNRCPPQRKNLEEEMPENLFLFRDQHV